MGTRSWRGRGVTLVEMLVLLVGLTVLLALLLPVLQAAEVTGRELSCRENLHLSGARADAWSRDHHGRPLPVANTDRYPGEVFAHNGYDRRALLADYTGEQGLTACPASGGARPGDAGNRMPVLYGTYAWIAPPGPQGPEAEAVDPARTAHTQDVLIDAQRGFGGFGQRYNHGTGVQALREGNPAFAGYWGGEPMGLNTLYRDGHAAWHGAGDVGVVGWATGKRQRRVYGVVFPSAP